MNWIYFLNAFKQIYVFKANVSRQCQNYRLRFRDEFLFFGQISHSTSLNEFRAPIAILWYELKLMIKIYNLNYNWTTEFKSKNNEYSELSDQQNNKTFEYLNSSSQPHCYKNFSPKSYDILSQFLRKCYEKKHIQK